MDYFVLFSKHPRKTPVLSYQKGIQKGGIVDKSINKSADRDMTSIHRL
jgi:hypothetical protein